MAMDMKQTIAQAARDLLMDKSVKKLTVKDIVEQCHITRQAFYYHFEDIPALFRWMLESNVQHSLLEAQAASGGEERLRSLFVMAINSMPYVKKSMESNYREDVERFIGQYFQNLFQQSATRRPIPELYPVSGAAYPALPQPGYAGALPELDGGGYEKSGPDRTHGLSPYDRGASPLRKGNETAPFIFCHIVSSAEV